MALTFHTQLRPTTFGNVGLTQPAWRGHLGMCHTGPVIGELDEFVKTFSMSFMRDLETRVWDENFNLVWSN